MLVENHNDTQLMTRPARIIVIEDNPGYQKLVTSEIAAYRDRDGSHPYVVAGVASTLEEARTLIESADYSVVVLDLSLVPWPDFYPHGFELAVLIRELRADTRIVLWSLYATVEGDLLRRAAQPWGDRFLVDAIVGKEQPFEDLIEAIHVLTTKPSVYFWVDPALRPPRSYSAILAFTHAEDEWIRDFSQHPGSNRRDVMARLHIKSGGTYSERRDKAVAKIARELVERRDNLLAMIPGSATMGEVELSRSMTDEVILKWARRRNLDWPITDAERHGRVTLRAPNAPSTVF